MLNRIKIKITDDIFLSVIQGEHAYCTEGKTVEVAVIGPGPDDLSEPQGHLTGHDLANLILDLIEGQPS